MDFKKSPRCIATCLFGFEKTLAFEIRRAGGEVLETRDGRVIFSGGLDVLARVNLTSSVAERAGILAAEFPCRTFDDVFEGVSACDLSFLPYDAAFPVTKGRVTDSVLTSVPALQRTVKKALAVALSRVHGGTLYETGVEYRFTFLLLKDYMTLTIDGSGDGLHKRGYRLKSSVAAPLRETLAAGLCDIARVRAGDVVVDPFCGSGTILIESALKALHIPPGTCCGRTFAPWLPKVDVAKTSDAGAESSARFRAYGFDVDSDAVKLTRQNAAKAGVGNFVTAEICDIRGLRGENIKRDFSENTPVKIITNPPYGERISDEGEARSLLTALGSLTARLVSDGVPVSFVGVITPCEDFERLFCAGFGRGVKFKNRKLSNGTIKTRFYFSDKFI